MSGATDWTTLPLAGDGRSLVEASAGTGKTWTIAALYLRLLLEQGLAPRQIVVGTFTNAAAAELSERLRGRLLWALAEAGQARADEAPGEVRADRAWLHDRWRAGPAARARDVQRLQAALTGLDGAPVGTLHSLCARILAEHPFAAGALFRGRTLVDARTLEADLVADLWRVISQGDAADELVGLARTAGISRKELERYVPALLQPDVSVAPTSPATVLDRVGDLVGDPGRWADDLQAVLAQPALISPTRKLAKAWQSVATALSDGGSTLADALCAHHEVLAEAAQMTGVNKVGKEHPGVQALVKQSVALATGLPALLLDRAANPPLRGFLAAAQRWCRKAMQVRLDAANQSTFDQLIHHVRAALVPRDGQRALADALHAAWPVALVDEFQDTDPVQFGILDAIYRDGSGAARGRLVMIGDPKQAIYRFRGGDIAAYARARAGVPEQDRLTLGTNFRSSRGYVEAVNQFYAATGTGLGPPGTATDIVFEPVRGTGRRDPEPLRDATGRAIDKPLVLHELSADPDGGRLDTQALRACAAQVALLLAPGARRIGERPLVPGDIAVLLPGHAQVAALAGLLKALGIPCVTGSQKSVFESPTARDLRLVLHAVQHAEDPRAVRAALATRLLGGSLAGLQALRHDPLAWDRHAGRLRALHARLERDGPLAVVAALLDTEAARLLATVAGERMLTDLRHLGELLQDAWVGCGSGERLLAWFARQAADDADRGEAAESRTLRLESDAQRVRLMTLHASKGLEFGVVLLPLLWKHTRSQRAASAAHLLGDPGGEGRHLVFGPAKAQVKAQEYEERFRMLYVALTRAIHACHLFVPGPALLAARRALAEVPLNALDLSDLGAGRHGVVDRIARIDGWPATDGGNWQDGPATGRVRSARRLPPAPPGPLPMRHSFTTLAGGGRHRVADEEGAAEDETVAGLADGIAGAEAPATIPTRADQPPRDMATFHADLDALAAVAGADFGNAVHALFEHRRPGHAVAATEAIDALREHGVRPREGTSETLAEPLARRLNAVLEARLGDAAGPCLGDLPARDMRAELEFDYLLDGVDLRALRLACEAHGETGLVPLRDQLLAGLMNGKIDLVFAHGGRFHVLDYKSNQLARGPRACLEDYAPEAVAQAVAASGYRLQALLYTVALERHLRERMGASYRRDRHLGECWYLFIRAIGLVLPDGRPCGLWRHRFGDGLLDAVQRVLGLEAGQPA